MNEPTDQHHIWIIWGSDPQAPMEYSFPTIEELSAFLEGVNEACGYLECETFETKEAADEEWAAYLEEQSSLEQ